MRQCDRDALMSDLNIDEMRLATVALPIRVTVVVSTPVAIAGGRGSERRPPGRATPCLAEGARRWTMMHARLNKSSIASRK